MDSDSCQWLGLDRAKKGSRGGSFSSSSASSCLTQSIIPVDRQSRSKLGLHSSRSTIYSLLTHHLRVVPVVSTTDIRRRKIFKTGTYARQHPDIIPVCLAHREDVTVIRICLERFVGATSIFRIGREENAEGIRDEHKVLHRVPYPTHTIMVRKKKVSGRLPLAMFLCIIHEGSRMGY
jgi:hypothetical protein